MGSVCAIATLVGIGIAIFVATRNSEKQLSHRHGSHTDPAHHGGPAEAGA